MNEYGQTVDIGSDRLAVLQLSMADPGTLTDTRSETALATPWNVLVHDDPVNLMEYVTRVLMKVFGYNRDVATRMMMEVHLGGRSVVWTGEREKAEHYVHQLHAHQLQASLEKSA